MKDLSQTYSFEHTALISKQFSGLKSTERECRQKQNKNKPPLKKKEINCRIHHRAESRLSMECLQILIYFKNSNKRFFVF